jgi:hypothetical protein
MVVLAEEIEAAALDNRADNLAGPVASIERSFEEARDALRAATAGAIRR